MRTFVRKYRTEEMVKTDYFYARFDEQCKAVERCDRAKMSPL